MSRRPARCTEADLSRAIRAADRAGAPRAVKVDPDGTIWLVPVPADAELRLEPRPSAKRRIVL